MRAVSILLLFILVSCSSSKVITDYDSSVNFVDFKTYALYDDVGKGLNELDVKRVTTAIDYELKELGFRASEQPDFYINIISNKTEAQNNNTIGIGIGSGGRNGGFGISGGIPIGGKKLNEEFIVEFVNAKTDKIFWEGRLNSTIRQERTPEVKELYYKKIVNEILGKYPPKRK